MSNVHFSLTLDYIKLSQYWASATQVPFVIVANQEILCSCVSVVLKFPAEKTVKPRIVYWNLSKQGFTIFFCLVKHIASETSGGFLKLVATYVHLNVSYQLRLQMLSKPLLLNSRFLLALFFFIYMYTTQFEADERRVG